MSIRRTFLLQHLQMQLEMPEIPYGGINTEVGHDKGTNLDLNIEWTDFDFYGIRVGLKISEIGKWGYKFQKFIPHGQTHKHIFCFMYIDK